MKKASSNLDREVKNALVEYKILLDQQSKEREMIIEELDKFTLATTNIGRLDEKIEIIRSLLLEMKTKFEGTSNFELTSLNDSNPDLVESKQDLSSLSALINEKAGEVQEKDSYIENLNHKIERLSSEKFELNNEIEKMNKAIENWKNQLELLEKLALTDPRYKIIGVLKKHEEMSEIQLAFTLGNSIIQVKKYLNELLELGLIQQLNNGKIVINANYKGSNDFLFEKF